MQNSASHSKVSPTDRYSRQEHCAPGFSQEALRHSSVLIVGVGGLGTHVATHLAMAGVGTIHICDHDTISPSNLNRQMLYRDKDIGKEKTTIACKRLQKLNPDCHIVAHSFAFTAENAVSLPATTLIIDCLDSLESRVNLIRYAKSINVPVIHGAIHGFYGQLSVYLPPHGACPFCALSNYSTDNETSTKDTVEPHDEQCTSENQEPIPSLGACVAVIASLQATEAIKYICHIGNLRHDGLYMYNLLDNEYTDLALEKNPHCAVCSSASSRGAKAKHSNGDKND